MSLPSTKFIRAIAEAYSVEPNDVSRRAGYPVDSDQSVSDWVMGIARRIERRTEGMARPKRDAIERAIDNILIAAA